MMTPMLLLLRSLPLLRGSTSTAETDFALSSPLTELSAIDTCSGGTTMLASVATGAGAGAAAAGAAAAAAAGAAAGTGAGAGAGAGAAFAGEGGTTRQLLLILPASCRKKSSAKISSSATKAPLYEVLDP